MRYQSFRSLVILFGLSLLAMPALAHHSSAAEFNVLKEIPLSGTITKVDWVNPHTYIYVDVKDGSGKVTNWGLETEPPRILHQYGLKREMFIEGQTIEVSVNPAKDPSKSIGFLRHVKFQNGDEVNIHNHYVDGESQ
jgi:hypothetical protein